MRKKVLYPFKLITIGVTLVTSLVGLNAQQTTGEVTSISNEDIAGVVASSKGPEAGVWVIAETSDLPTKFVKIVVTDDQGRYVLPQLPKANYKVWVRGYGLVDSQPLQATPGRILNLKGVAAPNPRAAAEFYPALYWFSLLRVPDKSEFPGTGPKGNGIPENMKSQGQWLHLVKTDSCWSSCARPLIMLLPACPDSMVPPPTVGTSRQQHDQRPCAAWPGARIEDARGLDRSDRGR